MPTRDHRSRRTEAERLSHRTRVHARSLGGRLYVAAGKVLLVRGAPEREKLLACLEKRNAGESPTPAELGFASADVQVVTRSGLAARAKAVREWRAELQHNRRIRDPEKRSTWAAEVEALTARVAALHVLLAPDQPPTASPFHLSTDDEASLTAVRAELLAGRVVTPDVDWLARLAMWVDGLTTARRFLATAVGGLCTPHEHSGREALGRLKNLIARLADELGPVSPAKNGKRRKSPRRRETILQVRRESPLFDRIRREAAALPGGEVKVPTRNRDVDPAVLARQSDEALARYPQPPGWVELARVAALYLTDGGSTVLPWTFATESLAKARTDDEGEMVLSALLRQAGLPSYDALLDLVGRGGMCRTQYESAREFLTTGATSDDLRWAAATLRSAFGTGGDGRTLNAVRALAGWLEARDAALKKQDLESLWEAAVDPAGRAGVESINRYLGWLPAAAATPALAARVGGVVRLMSVPGAVREPIRDRVRTWADPPRTAPLPADCPADLPPDLRSLLRRLGFYLRAAGRPDRLPKSLLRPLTAAGRDEQERAHLVDLEKAGRLDDRQRARLRHLTDRPADPGPVRKLVRQAQEVCAITALDAVRKMLFRQAEAWWQKQFGIDARIADFRRKTCANCSSG